MIIVTLPFTFEGCYSFLLLIVLSSYHNIGKYLLSDIFLFSSHLKNMTGKYDSNTVKAVKLFQSDLKKKGSDQLQHKARRQGQ